MQHLKYRWDMKSDKINKNEYQRQAYIWNTISSLLNAGMSALLLLIVSQICGEKDAGMFTLAFSTAQLLVTIAYFEVRPYQVTDVENKYNHNDYYTFKIITCAAMLLFSIIYVFIGNYDKNKAALILLLCIFKMLDAFEDYYVALYQKNGRLDIGARKSSIRVLSSMIVFSLTIIIFRDVFAAVIAAIISSVIIILIWFVWKENKNLDICVKFYFSHIFKIGLDCLPMFMGSYLTLYIGNAPKYAIDKYMEIQYQTYYGILYMPSFVINLFSGFVFKPMINDIAKYYKEDKGKYRQLIFKVIAILTAISWIVITAGYLMGPPILGLLYGINLNDYKTELVIILLGGAISALGIIIYYIITVMRCQKWMLASYFITALAAHYLSPILVINYGIRGASMGFLFFNIIQTGIFIIILFVCSIHQRRV